MYKLIIIFTFLLLNGCSSKETLLECSGTLWKLDYNYQTHEKDLFTEKKLDVTRFVKIKETKNLFTEKYQINSQLNCTYGNSGDVIFCGNQSCFMTLGYSENVEDFCKDSMWVYESFNLNHGWYSQYVHYPPELMLNKNKQAEKIYKMEQYSLNCKKIKRPLDD